MSFLMFLAQAATPVVTSAAAATTTPAGTPAPAWLTFLNSNMIPIIVVLFAVMLFSSNGKRKGDRERKALLASLKRGDQVRMIGGEYGTVVDVRGAKVLVKVDESSNTKILYAREAIQAVETDKDAKDAAAKDEVTK